MERVALSWSGGKDSSLALQKLRRRGESEVTGLLTTVTEDYDRISMHGVRRSLLDMQAERLELPLEVVHIPRDSSNSVYEERMGKALEKLRSEGVRKIAFGDLFLEDIRRYREGRLKEVGMTAIFPLWRSDTTELAHSFISSGFRAIVCCVDTRKLDRNYCGAEFDDDFISSLPPGTDPCGENGEFHTFVYDGPIFSSGIKVKRGETVVREDFCFTDLKAESS